MSSMISVIICTRNRPDDVAICLPTVLACLRDNWELLLVDQSDNSKTREIAERLTADGYPALRYLPTETVGKSRALDFGISQASGTFLAFTDDDCEAPPDWLEQVAAEFEAAPDVDVLFGPVLPSPAIPDLQNVCVPSWAFTEARDLLPGEVCGMGANMALRRSVLSRLPEGFLFDPVLGPGAPFPAGEEGDFVYRLRRAGARAALRPSLLLYHRAWRSRDHWQGVLYGYGIGEAAFFAKHARCGDGWAARQLVDRLVYLSARAGAKGVLRRSNDDASLLRGLCRGLTLSLRMRVDRQTRLYCPAEAKASE